MAKSPLDFPTNCYRYLSRWLDYIGKMTDEQKRLLLALRDKINKELDE